MAGSEDLVGRVREQVIAWQRAIGEVIDGSGAAQTPAFVSQRSLEDARRARRLFEDEDSRALLLALADGVLVPEDPAEGARAAVRLAPRAAEAGIDLLPVRLPARLGPWAGRLETAAARVAPRRLVEGAMTNLRRLTGTVAGVGTELEEDLAYLTQAGLAADVELIGLPTTGPGGALAHAAVLRELVLGTEGLRRVTVSAPEVAPEACGATATARDAAVFGGPVPPDAADPDADADARLLAERVRPVLRAAREAGVEVTLTGRGAAGRPAAATRTLIDAVELLADEPEFHHLTLHLELPAGTPPETIERLARLAVARVGAGGGALGLRLAATGEAASAELSGPLDRLVEPGLAGAVVVTVASDSLGDHALAGVLAEERPGARRPRILTSPACPPERAWVLAQDADVAQRHVAVPIEPHGADGRPTGPDHVPVATARVLRLLAGAARDREDAGRFTRVTGVDDEEGGSTPGGAPAGSTAAAGGSPDRGGDPCADAAGEAEDLGAEGGLGAAADLEDLCGLGDREAVVRASRDAGELWAAVPAGERARLLLAAADRLERAGTTDATRLLGPGSAADEAGEAVDALRTAAAAARELTGAVADGARFEPDRLVVVAPSPAAPLAGPAAALGHALAAGASCVLWVAPEAAPAACAVAAAVRAALDEGQAPQGLVRVVVADEDLVDLAAHPGVDTVAAADPLLARRIEVARADRPGGPRVHTTPAGPALAVVDADADPERAALDLATAAFARGGLAPGAPQAALLAGPAAHGTRLRRALADAVAALPPVTIPADDPELVRELTVLDDAETWLVQPRSVDEDGRRWTPGVKDGIGENSRLLATRLPGPVLGLVDLDGARGSVRARALADDVPALGLDPAGPAAGSQWLDAAAAPLLTRGHPQAGVRRRGVAAAALTTGLDARRGPGLDLVASLGRWVEDGTPTRQEEPADPVRAALMDYTGLVHAQADRSWLRAAVGSDAFAWSHALVGLGHAVREGGQETFLRRTAPPVWVRAGVGTAVVELVRVLLAAETVGARVRLSLDAALSAELKDMDGLGEPARAGLRRLTPLVDRVEDVSSFAARVRSGSITGRVRVLGEEAGSLPSVLAGRGIELETDPVLAAGRLELTTLLRGQCLVRGLRG